MRAPRLLKEGGEHHVSGLRPELLDIHAGRDHPHALGPAHDLCEDGADVLGHGDDLGRRAKALARPGAELLVPAHRS